MITRNYLRTDEWNDVLMDVWTDAGQFPCGISSTYGRAHNENKQDTLLLKINRSKELW